MTVLPESPVREYAKRVASLMAVERERAGKASVPRTWITAASPWLAGFRTGLSSARAIMAEQAPLPGQETTRFEYRAAEVKGDVSTGLADWRPTHESAGIDWAVAAEGQPFGELVIERRTVTVTEPVRLDSDGEPVS
jgi:hypothetical protein